MKGVGYFLIAAGFSISALAGTASAIAVDWMSYGFGMAIAIVGVVLARLVKHKIQREKHKNARAFGDVLESLRRVTESVSLLEASKDAIDVYDMCHRIDESVLDDLNRFVEVRESLIHARGLGYYAEVMSCFAAGERQLNRAWSASADGYVDEINKNIAQAKEHFAAARALMERMG
jgi:hypothetical protein